MEPPIACRRRAPPEIFASHIPPVTGHGADEGGRSDGRPVVVGGILPAEDAEKLEQAGVARVYTPRDYNLNALTADIVDIVDIVQETAMEAA